MESKGGITSTGRAAAGRGRLVDGGRAELVDDERGGLADVGRGGIVDDERIFCESIIGFCVRLLICDVEDVYCTILQTNGKCLHKGQHTAHNNFKHSREY